MPLIREVHAGGWCVRLDLDRQVLAIEVPERNFVSPGDVALSPTVPLASNGFVSAAALLWKAKIFDDGLLAATDLAVQAGVGRFVGKASLLRSLADVLRRDPAADPSAHAIVSGACQLGGIPQLSPDPVAQTAVAAFLADELRSKPLGFFTWSEPLRAVFRQDRFLQGELTRTQAETLAAALRRDPALRSTYLTVLDLASRLTNPPASPDLRSLLGDTSDGSTSYSPPAFLPPSVSHESALVERLFRDRPIPEGFDLASELIRRVRAGEVNLTPAEDSGWYDRLTWSLGPLILPDSTPEAGRLSLGARYRGHLEEVFKGTLALARETQVKQVKWGVAGCKGIRETVIRIRPELSVEPLAEMYRRWADCYRYVREVLNDAFGPAALRELHRLTPEGPTEPALADELTAMERLFEGAYRVACREIGHPPADTGEGDEAVEGFREWASGPEEDADLDRDGRMMVPVFHDVGRRRTKVWAFLGWDRTVLHIDYRAHPAVLSCEREGATRHPTAHRDPTGTPRVEFQRQWCEVVTPVIAEVYVGRLLDREEFRRLCDRHQSREEILANLR